MGQKHAPRSLTLQWRSIGADDLKLAQPMALEFLPRWHGGSGGRIGPGMLAGPLHVRSAPQLLFDKLQGATNDFTGSIVVMANIERVFAFGVFQEFQGHSTHGRLFADKRGLLVCRSPPKNVSQAD
jgi:hypothetical protein